LATTGISSLAEALNNKHQAVSQGGRRFGMRRIFMLCKHFQKPHNAGSRRKALFFDTPV
jgi:hypothetical protein